MRIDNILKDDSLPTSKKIQYIEKMIVKELNKAPDKVDLEKVHYYENLVEELGGEVCEKSDEDLAYNLVLIKNKARAAEESNVSKYIYKTKTTRTPFLKAMIAVAAVFVIIFSSFSVYALSVGGYGKAWEYVTTSVKELFDKKPGIEEVDGITIIKPNYTKKYKVISELLESEGIDILYPDELPNNIRLETIKQDVHGDKCDIILYFNNQSIFIQITDYYEIPDEVIRSNTNYKTEYLNLYILELDYENYQAVFHYKGYEYSIFSNDNEIIKSIILNLKGF